MSQTEAKPVSSTAISLRVLYLALSKFAKYVVLLTIGFVALSGAFSLLATRAPSLFTLGLVTSDIALFTFGVFIGTVLAQRWVRFLLKLAE